MKTMFTMVARSLVLTLAVGGLMLGSTGCSKCCKSKCDTQSKCAAGCSKPCCAKAADGAAK